MTENDSNIISRIEDVLAQGMRLLNYSYKTTEIYTHISQKTLGKIISPLDNALKTKTIYTPYGV